MMLVFLGGIFQNEGVLSRFFKRAFSSNTPKRGATYVQKEHSRQLVSLSLFSPGSTTTVNVLAVIDATEAMAKHL